MVSILLAFIVPLFTDSVIHRGDGSTRAPNSTALPENTIPAFERCWKLGFIPEGDVWKTTDGVLFAFHDPAYRGKAVKEMTWAEASAIDVGLIGKPKGTPATTARAPTWEKIFDAMAKDPKRRICLDKSTHHLKALAPLINARHIGSQCYYCAGNGGLKLDDWKSLVPDGKALLWIWTGTWKNVDIKDPQVAKTINDYFEKRIAKHIEDKFAGWDIVQIHVRVDRKDGRYVFAPSEANVRKAIAAIRACGKNAQVFPWTNGGDIEVYRLFAKWGCDSFGTDYSNVLEKLAMEK